MKQLLNLAASFAVGAIAVFTLDRALTRRRAGGLFGSELRLRSRIQAEIDRLASFPDAIRFQVEGPLVRLTGYVLSSEKDTLLARITDIPGVHRVHNVLSAVENESRLRELAVRDLPEEEPAAAPQDSTV